MPEEADRVPAELQALLTLWSGTGRRITERRGYEWKIAFGIWGAQLASIGLLLEHRSDIGRSFSWVYLIASLVLVGLHAGYVMGFIRVNNRKDAELGKAYEREITTRIHAGDDIAARLSESKSATAPLSWAHAFSAGVTFVLAVAGPFAVGHWRL